MKKKYIGMAWPSDGINDSEYWNYLPKKYMNYLFRDTQSQAH